jgi:hypothetical protein
VEIVGLVVVLLLGLFFVVMGIGVTLRDDMDLLGVLMWTVLLFFLGGMLIWAGVGWFTDHYDVVRVRK